jgi:hypothetical protein
MKPMWKRLKEVEDDELALRQLILVTEGWQTLVNWIRGSHNLPNKY